MYIIIQILHRHIINITVFVLLHTCQKCVFFQSVDAKFFLWPR